MIVEGVSLATGHWELSSTGHQPWMIATVLGTEAANGHLAEGGQAFEGGHGACRDGAAPNGGRALRDHLT